MQSNHAILLTAPGASAIAVVRLVGPATGEFLRRHFSKEATPGRCVHGDLADGGQIIDDPVLVALPDGGADVNLHGGPWVVRRVLELARREGFEICEQSRGAIPEEFADGGTILEREIAAYLPLARTELSLRVLLAQESAWEEFLSRQQASAALGRRAIRQILEDLSLVHLLHPPTVAIVGPPNVGKSTLANQLFGQERSITADLAGTTRDWVGEIANIDGLPVMLMDTPGIRETDDAIERTAIARSREQIERSQLVVMVLDASAPLDSEVSAMLAAYPRAIAVANKSDMPLAWDASSLNAIHTVATTGGGVGDLRHAIAEHFGCAEMDPGRPRWWTERQRAMLEKRMPILDDR
ncbi:MAG TPA: GTPase [Tepidisphaeraceae bacterium]|jgi:tRNA modification GTPase|nr:GTPase [Tepidisphaeraceae bacterium]